MIRGAKAGDRVQVVYKDGTPRTDSFVSATPGGYWDFERGNTGTVTSTRWHGRSIRWISVQPDGHCGEGELTFRPIELKRITGERHDQG